MRVDWSVNFRHRRAVDVSPMVEDKRGWSGLLSSVFGEVHVGSPKTEVGALSRRCVISVFGEWVDVSPMTEVKVPVSGSVSSVFGDAWMGGVVASDGWGEFMHSEPI